MYTFSVSRLVKYYGTAPIVPAVIYIRSKSDVNLHVRYEQILLQPYRSKETRHIVVQDLSDRSNNIRSDELHLVWDHINRVVSERTWYNMYGSKWFIVRFRIYRIVSLLTV